MSKAPQGPYPKQGVPYPYPTQQPAYHTQPQQAQFGGGYAPTPQQLGYFSYGAQGPYGVPPPPYSETTPGPARSGYNVMPQQVPQPYPSMASTGHYPAQQYLVGQYPAQGIPPNMVPASYDPGARFNTGATVNVPPPPPGYAPNAAQVASAQGQPASVQQRQAGWFSGGTHGGYTFW